MIATLKVQKAFNEYLPAVREDLQSFSRKELPDVDG